MEKERILSMVGITGGGFIKIKGFGFILKVNLIPELWGQTVSYAPSGTGFFAHR